MRKRNDSDSSVVESSKESSEELQSVEKYCILDGKCSHATNKCKNPKALPNKHKKRKKYFKPHT